MDYVNIVKYYYSWIDVLPKDFTVPNIKTYDLQLFDNSNEGMLCIQMEDNEIIASSNAYDFLIR